MASAQTSSSGVKLATKVQGMPDVDRANDGQRSQAAGFDEAEHWLKLDAEHRSLLGLALFRACKKKLAKASVDHLGHGRDVGGKAPWMRL